MILIFRYEIRKKQNKYKTKKYLVVETTKLISHPTNGLQSHALKITEIETNYYITILL